MLNKQKLVFLISQVQKTLWKERIITLLTLTCISFGFILLFIAFCYGEAFLNDIDSFRIKSNQTNTLVTIHLQNEDRNKKVNLQDIRGFLSKRQDVEETGLLINAYEQTQSGQIMRATFIDETFEKNFYSKLDAGRVFTTSEYKSSAAVCLVERDWAESKGQNIGDNIQFGGNDFEIVGIVRTMAFANQLFLPYSAKHRLVNEINGYTILLRTRESSDVELMHWKSFYGGPVEVLSTKEYFSKNANYLLTLFGMSLVIGLTVYIYSLINTYNIMVSRMVLRAKSYGIRMAIGADQSDVFGQVFLEVLSIMVFSVILVFCSDPIIAPFLKGKLNHEAGIITHVALIINALVTAMIIATTLLRRLNKVCIPELMAGKIK